MKKVIVAVALVAFLIFLIFNIICIYKTWSMKSIIINDITEYTDGTIAQYDGGKQAIDFFPHPSEVQNANNIYFHYEDSRHKSNFYHEYFSVFILDVQYSDGTVYEQIRNNFPETPNNEMEETYINVYENFDLEELCAKAVYCNDESQTVRYVVVYGINRETDINALILWNSSYW